MPKFFVGTDLDGGVLRVSVFEREPDSVAVLIHHEEITLQSNAERVPLTDEQINRLWDDSFIGADPTSGNQRFKFARAIEAEINKGQ